jgi:hypothetical protein
MVSATSGDVAVVKDRPIVVVQKERQKNSVYLVNRNFLKSINSLKAFRSLTLSRLELVLPQTMSP